MTPVRMTHRIAIETHYLGPTDYRGSRIVARTVNGDRLTLSYDHALDGPDNHAAAAAALADRCAPGWGAVSLVGGAVKHGMVFVIDPEGDAA